MERRRVWHTPLGILATLGTIFPIATFHDFLGVTGESWKAVFWCVTIIVSCWFVYCVYHGIRQASPTVEEIVERLRTDSLASPQRLRDATENDLPVHERNIKGLA